jgi:hypothetical protein
MSSYVLKEMPGSIRVFCYDRRIEISSPHVFAQCDKRLINYILLGNAGSPEGSLLEMGKRRTGFTFMRRKAGRETLGTS